MEVRFLGINGFSFRSEGETLLIDPYVSRDRARVSVPEVVRRHISKADYIAVSHSHWDHAADVGEIAKYTKAVVCGSETMLNICRYFGAPESRLRLFHNRQPIALGAFSVTPLRSKHKEPMGYPGHYAHPPVKMSSVADYLEGGTWALLVKCGGLSFLNVGSAGLIDEELEGIECEYLLAGIAGRAPDFLPRLLKCVRAKTLIPTHWDDFFGRPVEDPGERVDMAAFREEMRKVCPGQKVRELRPLEALELAAS